MENAKRAEYYVENGIFLVDKVPADSKQRIGKIDYLGIAQNYKHEYKNGRKEERFKIVDTLGPKEDVWFALDLHFVGLDMSSRRMIIKLLKDKIVYQWVTNKNMTKTQSIYILNNISKLEWAHIESSLLTALVGD